MSNPDYRYDLKDLERQITEAYADFVQERTEATSTKFVLTLKNLAYAILDVGKFWKQFGVDYEEVSFEYATYFYERVASGRYSPEGSDDGKYGKLFPWQQYIRLNLRHVVMNQGSHSHHETLLDEFDEIFLDPNYILENEEKRTQKFDKKSYGKELMKAIKVFYSTADLERIYPIARESIDVYKNKTKRHLIDEETREFLSLLIAVAKRLVANYKMSHYLSVEKDDYRKAFFNSLRSSLFLASLDSQKTINRELILSCDMDSLYRLMLSLGGQTVRIPTVHELQAIIASAVSLSTHLLEGKTPDECIRQTKYKDGLYFSKIKDVSVMVNNVMESDSIMNSDEPSSPILSALMMSVDSLGSTLKNIKDKLPEATFKESLEYYKVINDTLPKFMDSILNIQRTLIVTGEESETQSIQDQ